MSNAGWMHQRNAGTMRNDVARMCWRRALTNGAMEISGRVSKQKFPGAPGGDRLARSGYSAIGEKLCDWGARFASKLRNAAGNRRRERLIREEIIGHRMRAALGVRRGRIIGRTYGRTLALLHQPTREHRAGVFIEPLIEQRSDFLAEIGGVA